MNEKVKDGNLEEERERVKACRPYTIVEEGGGNQSGDCESAKLDPLLPRSREPFIKDVRTWSGRGLQKYLILRTISTILLALGCRQGGEGVKKPEIFFGRPL